MKMLSAFTWLFFAATSALSALLILGGLLSADHSPGPGAALEGAAQLMLLGLLVICIGVLIVCLKRRPPKSTFTPLNLVLSIVVYSALVTTVWVLPRATAGYTLTIQVLDTAKKPIQGALIRYESFQVGKGLARIASPANGAASTDVQGQITIHTNHQHRTDGFINKNGYRHASFIVDSEYFNRHQLSIDWATHNSPPGVNEHSFFGYLPATKDVLLTIYLPANDEEDELPYSPSPR